MTVPLFYAPWLHCTILYAPNRTLLEMTRALPPPASLFLLKTQIKYKTSSHASLKHFTKTGCARVRGINISSIASIPIVKWSFSGHWQDDGKKLRPTFHGRPALPIWLRYHAQLRIRRHSRGCPRFSCKMKLLCPASLLNPNGRDIW